MLDPDAEEGKHNRPLDLPPMPDPIRFAECCAALEWGIPLDEWDRKHPHYKMEMMATIDIRRKYDAYTKWQHDEFRRETSRREKPRGGRLKPSR